MNLYIKTLSVFSKELFLKWSDGSQQSLLLEDLRKRCPCAGCSGESDVLGNSYRFQRQKHLDSSFRLSHYETVGLYGLRFFWKDGHHDGIYTYKLLRFFDEKE